LASSDADHAQFAEVVTEAFTSPPAGANCDAPTLTVKLHVAVGVTGVAGGPSLPQAAIPATEIMKAMVATERMRPPITAGGDGATV
jgi:hypothetical protein